jgi:LysR family nitrogen assimilation transcriptional regulator
MNLRHLRYFTRIIELGSISQASGDLGIAQPALSKSVMILEQDLGARLLDRTSHGVTATDAGRRLYDQCQIIFSQVERARAVVADSANTPAGQVTIGMPNSIANILLMPLLRAVSKELPKIHLQVFQEPRLFLPDRIVSGRMDFGLMVSPSNLAGLRQVPLVDEKLVFVSGRKLGLDEGAVSPSMIANVPLIMPTRETWLRVFVESLFLAHSLTLDVRHEVDSTSHYVDCIEANLAATILPSSGIVPIHAKRRIAINSISDVAFRRTVSFATAESRILGIAATQVASLLQQITMKIIAAGNWPGATWLKQTPSAFPSTVRIARS